MATDSVMQLVRYQRSIGVLPQGGSFSVMTNWGRPLRLSALGGSVRKYIAGYKGATTYIKLNGLAGAPAPAPAASPADAVQNITGILPDLLNGINAITLDGTNDNTPGISQSWSSIMTNMLIALNKATSSGYTIAMDYFNILYPASNVANLQDAIAVAETVIQGLTETNSVTASGVFRLDIQTGAVGPPDPRPVFDWAVTVSLDSNTDSVKLALSIQYDHMESRLGFEIVLGVLAGGLVGPGGAIITGQIITQDYNATLNDMLLNAIAGPLSKLPWVLKKPHITITAPTDKSVILSVMFQLDPTAFNELESIINDVKVGEAWFKKYVQPYL